MRAALFAIAALGLVAAGQNQKIDEAYTAKIRQFTTEPFFLTELVDHLPASETVPDTREGPRIRDRHARQAHVHEGHLPLYARAGNRLPASAGLQHRPVGGGARDACWSAVSDESNLARLDRLSEINARLADPRRTPAAEAAKLIDEGLPFYWASGMHPFPRTGLARDADGTGLPPRRRGVAENPEHPATTRW